MIKGTGAEARGRLRDRAKIVESFHLVERSPPTDVNTEVSGTWTVPFLTSGIADFDDMKMTGDHGQHGRGHARNTQGTQVGDQRCHHPWPRGLLGTG